MYDHVDVVNHVLRAPTKVNHGQVDHEALVQLALPEALFPTDRGAMDYGQGGGAADNADHQADHGGDVHGVEIVF